jgi:crotonobetaine/carnitine-CoA ligase
MTNRILDESTSALDGAVDAREIPLQQRSFPKILALQSRFKDKIFIKSKQGTISYKEAVNVAALVAGNLSSQGLKKFDRVVVLLPNCLEILEVFLGAGWLGAVFVPINSAFRGKQLKHLLELVDPVAIVVSTSLASKLNEIDLDIPLLKKIWIVDDTDEQVPAHLLGLATETWTRGSTALDAQDIGPGDPLAILYTSGTTGPSKGVICPHGQFFWWGKLTGRALNLEQDDVAYTVLPMSHTNALNTLWQVLLAGGTFCFGTRFSASRFMQELVESRATVTYLLGSMIYMLLKQPESEYESTHKVRCALSPATSKKLVKQFRERVGIELFEGYGSTETNMVISNRVGGYEPGTMGRVVAEFEIKIVDELDQDVPDGDAGELIIRNREPFSTASGYFRNPEATVSAWRNLWFHSGDRVRMDSTGVLHFLDRNKDAIRRRGENISSWEVEQALISHDGVINCAVVGVPSELGEEEVMAFIELRDGSEMVPLDIIDYLESEIAKFAVPRYLEFVSEFPQTENGKVQKFALKERGVGNNTWDRLEQKSTTKN